MTADKKPRTKRTAAWKLAQLRQRCERLTIMVEGLKDIEAQIIAAERAELAARAAALPKE
jgi:hypothetical protein